MVSRQPRRGGRFDHRMRSGVAAPRTEAYTLLAAHDTYTFFGYLGDLYVLDRS